MDQTPDTHSLNSQIVMEWRENLQKWEGSAYYDNLENLDFSKSNLEFLLPLNFYTHSPQANREQRESLLYNYLPFQNHFIPRKQSTIIKNARWEAKNQDPNCRGTSSAGIPIKFSFLGKLVTLDTMRTSPPKIQCFGISFQFESYTPLGHREDFEKGSWIQSTPVFPISKDYVEFFQIHITGIDARCVNCQRMENKLMFRGFPPPLELSHHDFGLSFNQTHKIGNLILHIPHSLNSEPWMNDLLKIYSDYPIFKSPLENGRLVNVRVREDLLEEALVIRHSGEIHLGKTAFKSNFYLNKYHKYAFLKAIFSEWIFQILENSKYYEQSSSRRDHQKAATLAKIFGAFIVEKEYLGVDELRRFSESLSFIPFFNEIKNGKGIQNASVYLGQEEKGNSVDVDPFQTLFPVLSYGGFKKRMDWCFKEEAHLNWLELGQKYLKLELSISKWLGELTILQKSEKCPLFENYLINSPIPSHYSLHLIQEDPLKVQLRNLAPSENSSPLLVAYKDPAHWVFNDTKNSNVTKLSDGSAIQEKQVGEVYSYVDSPELTDPNRAKLPRPKEWLLSDFNFRYDSRTKNTDLEQGVSWRFLGDQKEKWLTLNSGYVGKIPQLGAQFRFLGWQRVDSEAQDSTTIDVKTTDFWRSGSWDRKISHFIPEKMMVSFGFKTKIASHRNTSFFNRYTLTNVQNSSILPQGSQIDLDLIYQTSSRDLESGLGVTKSNFITYFPLALFTTWVPSFSLLFSSQPVSLTEYFGLIGFDPKVLLSRRGIYTKNEARVLLLKLKKINLLNTFVFDHVLFFIGQSSVFMMDSNVDKIPENRSVQSVESGIRLLGSFLGSKDQGLTFYYINPLTSSGRPIFALKIGQN